MLLLMVGWRLEWLMMMMLNQEEAGGVKVAAASHVNRFHTVLTEGNSNDFFKSIYVLDRMTRILLE